MRRYAKLFGVVVLVFCLAACGSAQDRRDSFYKKAEAAVAAGKLDDAEVDLKNAIKIDPRFAKGYALLGDVQSRRNAFADAFASYQNAVGIDPDNIDAQLGLCKLYLLQGNMKKVGEKADFILKRQPGNVEAGVLKAIALTKEGRPADALALLARLEKAKPGDADVILAKCEALIASKNDAAAEAALKSAITRQPKNLLFHRYLANFYVKRGRLPEAEAQFLRIVALTPEDTGSNMLLARFYRTSGQTAKLLNFLAALVRRFPKNEQYRLAQGGALERFGSASAAEAALLAAHAALPDSKEIVLALAGHYAGTRQLGKVESLLKGFIADDPESPAAVRARRILAGAYLDGRRFDAAEGELKAVFKRNPRDMEGHLLMGQLDIERGRLRDAILELRQVVDDDPRNVRALGLLVRAHVLNRESLQAEALVRKAVADHPDDVPLHMLLVRTLVSMGKLDGAQAELAAMRRRNPKDPAILLDMGGLQLRRNDPAGARASYAQAAELAPRDPLPHFLLGRVLAAQRDLPAAEAEFSRALALNPDFKAAGEALVGLYFARKEPAKALDLARRQSAAHPRDGYYAMLLGRVLLGTGDLAGAAGQFAAAQRLLPNAPVPYQLLGQVKLRQGKTSEAIALYRTAFLKNPDDAAAGMALGTLYQTRAMPEQARQVYEQVLARHPGYPPAANNLAFLYVQDLPTAANVQKALALLPSLRAVRSPAAMDTVGWVLYRAGRVDAAVAELERAWKAGGLRPTAYHLGMALKAKGDAAKARTWFRQALAGNVQFPERAAAARELAGLGRTSGGTRR